MTQPASLATNRLGPFVAGSSADDLIARVSQADFGLRVLDPDEQARDYYKARCEALEAAAREFFHPFEGARSLILQKTRDTALLPAFTEYVYCWFAEDRLCGTILSGVTSDAGTHGQINEQEVELEAHASEVHEALERKYPERPDLFINYFNFQVLPAPPDVDGLSIAGHFSAFDRLITIQEENQSRTQVETAHSGPTVIRFSGKPALAEVPTGTTHSSQAFRKGFAGDGGLVIYDFKLERYVRTIESIHVYENLTYLSRTLCGELGRRLNGLESARVRTQAQAEIDAWRDRVSKAEEARRARVSRLSEIL